MQLRALQTIDGLGPTASNTVIIPLPLEILDGFAALVHKMAQMKELDKGSAPAKKRKK